jgi:hypothetical protein
MIARVDEDLDTFFVQSSTIHNRGQYARSLAAKALIAAARSPTGTFFRWESSSEGSNCRYTSLAAKALTTAANLIQTLITILIRFTL